RRLESVGVLGTALAGLAIAWRETHRNRRLACRKSCRAAPHASCREWARASCGRGHGGRRGGTLSIFDCRFWIEELRLDLKVGDVKAAVGVDPVFFVQLGGEFRVMMQKIADSASLAFHFHFNRIEEIDLQATAAPEDACVGRGFIDYRLP